MEKIIVIEGITFKAHINGNIYRERRGSKKGCFETKPAGTVTKHGYRRININRKLFLVHRLMMYAFKNFDYKNLNIMIDHVNYDEIKNNCIFNLRFADSTTNTWNKRDVKGYDLHQGKHRVRLKLYRKEINGGSYDTKEEAHAKYLEMKQEYHKF